MECPVCGTELEKNTKFCSNCRYPVGVTKLKELSLRDIEVHLNSFKEALEKQSYLNKSRHRQIFDELTSVFWLRPESALFRLIEASILLEYKERYLKYPLLDLGCGDGTFTAILFGAKINKKYDNFMGVNLNKRDIYNQSDEFPADFFVKDPEPVGYGVDIKENSVKKAKSLGFYDKVIKGDVRTRVLDQTVPSIFTNMIDDIETSDLPKMIQNIGKMLEEEGYFVFTTPTDYFHEYLFFYNKALECKDKDDLEGYNYYMELDRGRSNWEGRGKEFWLDLFKDSPLEVIEYIPYCSEKTLQFWDTGFRPYFPLLIQLRNLLGQNELLEPVKKVTSEFMKGYLSNLLEDEPDQEGAFSLVVARKEE